MTLVKSSLSLAALMSVFAAAGVASSAQAQDGRYSARCAMQCTSDSCLQRCESEHDRNRRRIKIVKIPPPQDQPVPRIVFNPGVDGGGNGGGGGGRGK